MMHTYDVTVNVWIETRRMRWRSSLHYLVRSASCNGAIETALHVVARSFQHSHYLVEFAEKDVAAVRIEDSNKGIVMQMQQTTFW